MPELPRRTASLIACLLMPIAASAFYAATYPLNLGLSDCPNYLRMIAAGSSNLINASGYPAGFYALLSLLGLLPAGDPLTDVAWLRTLQWAHFGVHTALFLTGVGMMAFLYGRWPATMLSLLWGFNLLFLGNLNSASPEWLQGDLLLICLLTCFCAHRAHSDRVKISLYLTAAIVLAVAYVVKFNSLLMVPALVLLVLSERWALWRKMAVVGVTGVTFAGLVLLYASTYHFRSTGTKQLTYDHGWVLILALPDDYFQTDPQRLGTNSLKWAALTAHVPPDYNRSHAYQHISYGSAIFPNTGPFGIQLMPCREANWSPWHERILGLRGAGTSTFLHHSTSTTEWSYLTRWVSASMQKPGARICPIS